MVQPVLRPWVSNHALLPLFSEPVPSLRRCLPCERQCCTAICIHSGLSSSQPPPDAADCRAEHYDTPRLGAGMSTSAVPSVCCVVSRVVDSDLVLQAGPGWGRGGQTANTRKQHSSPC